MKKKQQQPNKQNISNDFLIEVIKKNQTERNNSKFFQKNL